MNIIFLCSHGILFSFLTLGFNTRHEIFKKWNYILCLKRNILVEVELYPRTWFHAKCVADGTASAETINCARCDKVLLDSDATIHKHLRESA